MGCGKSAANYYSTGSKWETAVTQTQYSAQILEFRRTLPTDVTNIIKQCKSIIFKDLNSTHIL